MMKMTNATFSTLRWLLVSLAFVFATILAACGPGTGGTGTGPSETLQFSSVGSSSPSPASSPAPIATPSPMPTPVPGNTQAPVATPVPTPTPAPSAPACEAVQLKLEKNAIALSSPCIAFAYQGAWSADAAQRVQVLGIATIPSASGSSEVPARLQLQFNAAPAQSTRVVVRINSVDGSSLLPATELSR